MGTLVAAINGSGAVAGDYYDSSGTEHGFTYINGTFSNFSDPNAGSMGTNVAGISDSGEVAGNYYDISGTVTTLELAGVEAFVQVWPGLPGRPPCDRATLARAFIAKSVSGLPVTAMLIERLAVDKQLRRLCGREHPGQVPQAWAVDAVEGRIPIYHC